MNKSEQFNNRHTFICRLQSFFFQCWITFISVQFLHWIVNACVYVQVKLVYYCSMNISRLYEYCIATNLDQVLEEQGRGRSHHTHKWEIIIRLHIKVWIVIYWIVLILNERSSRSLPSLFYPNALAFPFFALYVGRSVGRTLQLCECYKLISFKVPSILPSG